ncbi:MAG: XdhC family protein [Thermoplasmatales archaeon]
MNNWEFPQIISGLVNKGEQFVIATVVRVSGSSLGKPGFKEVISSDGNVIYGTLGGACPDSAIVEKAMEVLKTGSARTIKVFLEDARETLVGMARNVDDEIHVETNCGGVMDVYLEPYKRNERLVIIGQGGRDEIEDSLVSLAKSIGISVTVIDPNPILDSKPDEIVDSVNFPIADFNFREDDFVVVLTKGARDIQVLEAVSKYRVKYVGLLASKKRIKADIDSLEERGVSKEFLESLHAPIGLDIGAVTPREISFSIISEIISVRREHGPR